MVAKHLRIVEVSEGETLEQRIELALIQHRQAMQHVQWAEQELEPLRKKYAKQRGEFLLPTLERLRREFLR